MNEPLSARVLHAPQVGCVYLSVTIESAEVLIDRRRIEKGCQPSSQMLVEATFAKMENVEMVFKSQRGEPKVLWQDCVGHDSSILLF